MIEKAEDLTVYVHSSRIVRNLNQVWNMKMYGYAHLRHVVCTCIVVVAAGWAGSGEAAAGSGARAFAQLDQELPTANVYRTASGAPGSQYWQQQADYKIDVELDEAKRALSASAGISYTNNSPDSLAYLWLQLDQNRFADNSLDRLSRTVSRDRISYSALRQNQSFADNELGYRDLSVTDARGKPLPFTVVDTLMRIDLPTPLKPGRKIAFVVDWRFNIIEEVAIGGRGGYEHFEESDTYLFALAQWFPRLAAYSDFEGWHNKAFLGRGEFALEFGDYEVALTVPADHVVSASGVLTNPREVLSAEQRRRLSSVGTDRTTFIVTPEEALANQAERATGKKPGNLKRQMCATLLSPHRASSSGMPCCMSSREPSMKGCWLCPSTPTKQSRSGPTTAPRRSSILWRSTHDSPLIIPIQPLSRSIPGRVAEWNIP